ncbi:MAG: hypothetical protein AAGF98_05265, partial [Cyanobacteria bacterium P01_H01_bin.153]
MAEVDGAKGGISIIGKVLNHIEKLRSVYRLKLNRENMFDPKVLSEYALSHMDASAESIQNSLNLFQVFKRLYEQNPALLSEILNMATVDKQMPV